jgi:hypothetical protein
LIAALTGLIAGLLDEKRRKTHMFDLVQLGFDPIEVLFFVF